MTITYLFIASCFFKRRLGEFGCSTSQTAYGYCRIIYGFRSQGGKSIRSPTTIKDL
jgi:hypothetical protein